MCKGFLTNLTKFTEKHLCQRLFFNKIAGLRPAGLLKKIIWHRCFPVNFIKFLRTPFIWKFFEISEKTFYTEYLWATGSSQIVSQVSRDY